MLQVTYTHDLGRFYMWAQTATSVFIVCHVPTGGMLRTDMMHGEAGIQQGCWVVMYIAPTFPLQATRINSCLWIVLHTP